MSPSKQANAAPSGETDFNAWSDAYRDEVARANAFTGATPEFFAKVKADHLVEMAERQLGDPSRLDVLDVGCGVGATHHWLEGRFGRLVGTDIAAEAVERAAAANPWASYTPHEVGEPLPAEDASFDLSFAINVMHHVPPSQWGGFVDEMARTTKPGGIVAIFEHNPYNPLTRYSVHSCAFDEGVVLLSRRRTRRLLAEQGLDPVAGAYIVFFPKGGRLLEGAERRLGWLPLGGQHYVAARRPEPASA